jgi:O-antigen chain-terminating methyltransferase
VNDAFYRAFEDRYRGTREDIKSRLQAYRPWLEALKAMRPDASALDLGCGRGEWLEVLREAGIAARGVDLDAGMLAGLRDAGFDVEQGDAIARLRATPADSLLLVSALHLVEHLPFEQVEVLVREALRVLVPGGLLLMETPNPENIVVGATLFYQDPTHVRPMPPTLLAFVPEHQGFARTKILRMNEPRGLADYRSPSLQNVLCDVSPDYAVVAQKSAGTSSTGPFDDLFSRPSGVTLSHLVAAYDRHAREQEAHLWRAIEALQGAVRDAQDNVRQMVESRSWRITAPLRAVAGLLKKPVRR